MANRKRKISYDPARMSEAIRQAGLTNQTMLDLLPEPKLRLNTFNQCQSYGTIMPEHLRNICKALNANPDYIAGISDYPLSLSYAQAETKAVDRDARIELPVYVEARQIATASIYDLNYSMLRERGLNPEILRLIKNQPGSDLEYWAYKYLDYAISYAKDEIERNIKYFDENGNISGEYSNLDIEFDIESLRSELKQYSSKMKKLFEERKKESEEK